MIAQTSILVPIVHLLMTHVSLSSSFIRPENYGTSRPYQFSKSLSASTTDSTTTFSPVFDFADNTTVASFERIDDAIMGGISTSTVRQVPGKDYASWSGVCRIDGGGFCGMRTLAFEEPLQVGDAHGFYIDCRLVSDDEPEKRVWKMTTRSKASRGEELYQAQLNMVSNEWTRVLVPFSSFKLVRGPRMVPDAAPLNTTGGLYQIGLSLSKFQMAQNMTELENFRPGYFNVELKTIGVYSHATNTLSINEPSTLSLEESKRKRPILVKILAPVFGLLFSEESRRRKSAMRLLVEEKGMSRRQAIMFGIRQRAKTYGMFRSVLAYSRFFLADTLRTVSRTVLNYGLFWPIRLAMLLPTLPAKWLSSPKDDKSTTAAENSV